MKKILALLLFVTLLLFVSCTTDKDYEQTNYCKNSTIVVLKKDFFGGGRGTSRIYRLYVFNGSEALWYETNPDTYSKYKVNDTLPTLVLMTVNTFKK